MANTTTGGLIKSSAQWTPAQHAWLKERAARMGRASAASVARMVVQAAMDAEKREEAA